MLHSTHEKFPTKVNGWVRDSVDGNTAVYLSGCMDGVEEQVTVTYGWCIYEVNVKIYGIGMLLKEVNIQRLFHQINMIANFGYKLQYAMRLDRGENESTKMPDVQQDATTKGATDTSTNSIWRL